MPSCFIKLLLLSLLKKIKEYINDPFFKRFKSSVGTSGLGTERHEHDGQVVTVSDRVTLQSNNIIFCLTIYPIQVSIFQANNKRGRKLSCRCSNAGVTRIVIAR